MAILYNENALDEDLLKNVNGGYIHQDSSSGEWQVIDDEDGSVLGSYASFNDVLHSVERNEVSNLRITDTELADLRTYGKKPRR